MKIERLTVTAYGRIAGWERDLDDVTVILGENEAGKSTVRDLVTTLLYGFDPASESQHPYVPWDGAGRIAFEARLRLGDGRRLTVGRRLLSTPQGTQTVLDDDGRVLQQEALRNRPLAPTGRVGRELYRAAFTVGAPDLRMFARDAWSALEAEFLGDAGSGGLRRASEVLARIQADANALWRPDKRARTRSGALDDRARDLERALREARANDERRHEAEAKLAQTEQERARLEERRKRVVARAGRLERLQARADEIGRLDCLRERAGDPALLAGLPADPAARLAELREETQRLAGRMEDHRSRRDAAAARATLPEADAAVLARADDIQAALASAAQLPRLRDEAVRAEEALGRSRAALRRAAEAVLAIPWSDEAAAALRTALAGVPQAELDTRAKKAEQARRDVEDMERNVRAQRLAMQQAAAAGAARRNAGEGAPSGVTALVSGMAVLGAGVFAGGVALALVAGQVLGWVVAIAGAGVAVMAGAVLRSARRAAPSGGAAADDLPAALVAELEHAREEASRRAEGVRTLVTGIPVAPGHLEAPGEDLARGLAELRRALDDWTASGRQFAERRAAVGAAEAAIVDLARDLGLVPGDAAEAPGDRVASPVARPDALQVSAMLKRRLDEAAAAPAAARSAEQERDHLDESLCSLAADHDRLAAQLQAFLDRLAKFDDDPDRACLEAADRMRAHQQAQEIADRLESETGGLAEVRREVEAAVAAGDLPWTEERRAEADREVDELVRRLNETASRETSLRDELGRLSAVPRADDLAGELAACREEAARLRRERDRLALLAAVVRLADRRFRDEHRPDILRRAGEHLAAFTGGCYDHVDFDDAPAEDADRKRVGEAQPGDGGRDAPVLVIRGSAAPDPRPVAPPLSQGTLHQVHLALRLALADHLDDGQERLPVCLDETFVHWDGGRRASAISHLRRWARDRQVLLFTCHPWFAEEAVRLAGATVVKI